MPKLIVITGPTGSGKTDLAIKVARYIGCDIISADSRQIYRGIPITTAAPTYEQQKMVRHHFVEQLELDQYYSAAKYEEEVMALLPELWRRNDTVVMCGGSMMYIDAVCHGIDELPTVTPKVRDYCLDLYQRCGLEAVTAELRSLDPEYIKVVDLQNHKRLIHALEICIESGQPYSALRTGERRSRDFEIEKIAIDIPRQEMYERINRRVDAMISAGMEQEARSVYHLRHLNSLNTVGFKELFSYFDGTMDRTTAIERIKKNTRVYAKKQLTWLRKDPEVVWLSADAALRRLTD